MNWLSGINVGVIMLHTNRCPGFMYLFPYVPGGIWGGALLTLSSFLFFSLRALLRREERLRTLFHSIKIREFRNFDFKPSNWQKEQRSMAIDSKRQRTMDRRRFLTLSGQAGLGIYGLSILTQCGQNAAPRQPNFVFLMIDDLGWKDVGFMGSRYYETPNIDKLASQGMYFTNAYANAPNCAPSRACLLAGQYAPRHGVFTVGTPERGDTRLRKLIPTPNERTLDPEIVTIAEALKPAGYMSASIGKWHLGNDPKLGPAGQGFDVNIAGDHHGHPPAGYFSPYELPNVENAPEGEYLTDRLTREALTFIEESNDRPFFLYLPYYAVHMPIQAPEPLIEKYSQKEGAGGHNNPGYAAMIERVDTNIGKVLEKLDELDLAENTVVIFFSDNGGHGNVTTMTPLRGSKGQIYEGGIRVPLAMRWPGVVPSNSTCDVPVIGIDFYPTLLEMAGIEPPPGQIPDGQSLLPLLRETGNLDRETLYWHFPAYLEPYNNEQWPWRITPCSAIRKGDWKLIEFFEYEELELYNLREDIGEQQNLSEQNSEKVQELVQELRNWRQELQAPVPNRLNPGYDPQAVEPPE